MIVTALPLLTIEPPAGRWSRTTPFWPLSVTLLVFSASAKRAAISALVAFRARSPVTFGTLTAVGGVAVLVVVEVVGVVVELVRVEGGGVVVVDPVVVVSVLVVGVVAVLVTRTNDTSTVRAAPRRSYDAAVALEPPEEPVEPAP